MSEAPLVPSDRFAARLTPIAWGGFVPVLGIFFVLRVMPGHAAFLLAQIAFLVPVAVAASMAGWVYWTGPRGAEKSVWGLLALAATFLLVGECYYSWYQITVASAGPPPPSVYDYTNLAAALLYLLMVGVSAGVDRMQLPAVLRLASDGVAVLAVGYAWLYHFWVDRMAAGGGWRTGAVWTAYSLVGLAIIGAAWWLVFGHVREYRGRGSLVGASIGVFAVGMVLSPILQSDQGGAAARWEAALVGTVFLAGYWFLVVAAAARLAARDEPWREVMSRQAGTDSIWPSTALSAAVLASVALIGRWAYGAPGGQ
jgi:hypothetical protein